MGKKRIIKKTEEELIKEREAVDEKVRKEYQPFAQKAEREGKVYIFASYNNTIITLCDAKGNVLGWTSAGSIGFKGTKKSTPFAASKVAEAISQIIKKFGIQRLSIFVKGVGAGRESAIRSLAIRGFDVGLIKDITSLPHNGCRPRKVRRV